MNSDVEKFIKGESKNSYRYFGAHKVSGGACFRLYAPHAKSVELSLNETNYKMEKIDFRGVFETRIQEIKEFDSYQFEILTSDNVWVNKNDPYTFSSTNGKSAYIEEDEYIFDDEKWLNKDKKFEYFNACLLSKDFIMDDQREFIEYLLKYHYNYVILKPYDDRYPYCINKLFINESSLKKFIDNLHQSNIGVIFDFETETFNDYPEGLDNFDGESIYNLIDNKYKSVDEIYYDFTKNATISYVKSWVHYYMENFHSDGLYINHSEFNKELVNEYESKIIIYKGDYHGQGMASDAFVLDFIDNLNSGVDCKRFINTSETDQEFVIYDYDKCLKLIKGHENTKRELARLILALVYSSKSYCISVYNRDNEYLNALDKVSELYSHSKALHEKSKKNLLYDGRRNKCFAYEYVSKNDYILVMINFSDKEDEKFDLGMKFYGYYTLILDTKDNISSDELFFTRGKKVHNKEIALQMHLKPNQVLVYKRMKDI